MPKSCADKFKNSYWRKKIRHSISVNIWPKQIQFSPEDQGVSTSDYDYDDIRNLKPDERPQIVVLDPLKDISIEGLEKEIQKAKQDEDGKFYTVSCLWTNYFKARKIEEGKIIFRKPEKRLIDNSEASQNQEKKVKKNETRENQSEVCNKRLLSFDEEYE